jgi:hypothetical protein
MERTAVGYTNYKFNKINVTYMTLEDMFVNYRQTAKRARHMCLLGNCTSTRRLVVPNVDVWTNPRESNKNN